MKCFVYFIFLSMTVCICLNAADVKSWFGDDFGNILRFAQGHLARFYSPIMGSIIVTLVQLFFCYRIFVIRRSAWPLSAIIALIAVAHCAGGVGIGIRTFISNAASRPPIQPVVLPLLWVVGAAIADILIAIVMTVLLYNATAVATTRDAIRRIVRVTVETNVITAGTAAIMVGLSLARPKTSLFIGPAIALPGIYANTLLLTLNNRILTRRSMDAAVSTLSAGTNISFGHSSGARKYSKTASAPPVPPRNPDRRTFDSERTATAARPLSADKSRWRPGDLGHAPPDDESVYRIGDDEDLGL